MIDLAELETFNGHKVQMTFYPVFWHNASSRSLSWVVQDFPPLPRSSIPQASGVYAFVVEPDLFSLAPANGLFYVGKATNLYNRIGYYISQQGIDFHRSSRPHVWRMLNRWAGSLKYYYVLTESVEEAETLEEEILAALVPPFNRAFPASVSGYVRAF